MKAKTVKIGDYEVMALLYEEKDNSFFDLVYYAKKGNILELMFLEEGNKKDFKTFGEENAAELIDKFSNKIDLKVESMETLYKTDKRVFFMNGQEDFPQGEEEIMYDACNAETEDW